MNFYTALDKQLFIFKLVQRKSEMPLNHYMWQWLLTDYKTLMIHYIHITKLKRSTDWQSHVKTKLMIKISKHILDLVHT
jgi:hypothetical protein